MKSSSLPAGLPWGTALAALVAATALLSPTFSANAQDSSFLYHGNLNEQGSPANGNYDVRFRLFDAATSGTQKGADSLSLNVPATGGAFTTDVDFGAGAFTGDDVWMELAVKPAGSGNFVTLAPRHKIHSLPAASFSQTAADVSGVLDKARLPGDTIYGVNGIVGPAMLPPNVVYGDEAGIVGPAMLPSNLVYADQAGIVGPAMLPPTIVYTGIDGLVGPMFLPPNLLYLDGGTTVDKQLVFDPGVGVAPFAVASAQRVALLNADFLDGNTAESFWRAGGNSEIVEGLDFLGTANNVPLEFRVNNQRVLRLEYPTVGTAPNLVGGFSGNSVAAGITGAVIAGGGATDATQSIGSGSHHSVIGGGVLNKIGTSSPYSVIPGGLNNAVGDNAEYAFAAGRHARANHVGAFVWADGVFGEFASDRVNQFKVRAGGGMHVVAASAGLNPPALRVESTTANGVAIQARQTSSDATLVLGNSGTGDLIKGFSGPTSGALVLRVDNDGDVTAKSFVPSSDRNLKENFVAVDPRSVLEKVAALPISQWNFKADTDTPHIGPMAQDFHAAFGVGPDDRHIATVDADGVALAAIQGLNRKLEERLEQKEAELADMKARLAALEARLGGR